MKRRKLISGDYEVGYGKAPVETRYKPGQSGNPGGRPKGARNNPWKSMERYKALIEKEANRKIQMNAGDKILSMTMIEAMVRGVAVKAAKGDVKSAKWFFQLNMDIENDKKHLAQEYLRTAIEYKQHWHDILEYRRVYGIYHAPDPNPHPDDIVIDLQRGTVEYKGPITPEEKKLWRQVQQQREAWRRELVETEAQLKQCWERMEDGRYNRDRLLLQIQMHERDKAILVQRLKETDRVDEAAALKRD